MLLAVDGSGDGDNNDKDVNGDVDINDDVGNDDVDNAVL